MCFNKRSGAITAHWSPTTKGGHGSVSWLAGKRKIKKSEK